MFLNFCKKSFWTILFLAFIMLLAVSTQPAFAGRIDTSTPASGATDVAVNTTITIQLLSPDSFNTTTYNNIVISSARGSVAGTARLTMTLRTDDTLVFTPSSNLSYGTLYTVNLSRVTDAIGTAITPAAFSFTTTEAAVISSTSPTSGATGISTGATVSVTFNKNYDAASLPSAPLTNSNSGARVPGAYSYTSARTVTFTPTSALAMNTNYTMSMAGTTFNAGAETLTGTTSFRFQTINTPANISLNVSPSSTTIASNQPIAAVYTFTESTGQNATITSSTAYFLNSSNTSLGSVTTPVSFSIRGGQRTQYSDIVSIPASVSSQITDGQMTYRRYFYGTDDAGNRVTVSGDVTVTFTSSLGTTFSVTSITVDTPINNSLFKRNSNFSAHAFIKGEGTGTIEGYWYIDDIPLDYFRLNMTNGITVQISTKNQLFTSNYGDHKLTVRLVSPSTFTSSDLTYSVSEMASNIAFLNNPSNGRTFKTGDTPPVFNWTAVPNTLGYKIAFARSQNDFDGANWVFVDKNSWIPAKNYWENLEPGIYYWAIKAVNIDRTDSPMSKPNYFIVRKGTSKKEPVKGEDKLLAFNNLNSPEKFFYRPLIRDVANSSSDDASAQDTSPLIQGNLNSSYMSSEPLNTRMPLYNYNYNVSLNQPLDKGNFSITSTWSNNPYNYTAGTQISSYTFNANYGGFESAVGNLAFDESEFSLYSQSKLGSSFGYKQGSSKVTYKKISDNGQNALSQTTTGQLLELETWAFSPFKMGQNEDFKIVYLKGKQNPDVSLPDYSYIKPQDSKITSIYLQKLFFKDKVALVGEYARGHYNQDMTDGQPTNIDNAIRVGLVAASGDFEVGSRYRCIGTNYGTIGNPYLEKDQSLFENYLGWQLGTNTKAKYLVGNTFNDLNGSATIIGAQSVNSQVNLDITPVGKGWPSSLNFGYTLNTVATEATAFAGPGLNETSAVNYGLSYPITDKINAYLNHSFTHYNDLTDLQDDSTNNSVSAGTSIGVGKKMRVSCSYSSNISRNLTTFLDNQFSSMYLQTDYQFIPNIMSLNLVYSKNLSASNFFKSNTDIMDMRLNYKLKAQIFNRIEEFTATLQYKFKSGVDYVSPALNTGYGNVVLLINNLFSF